jgi:hypothetical protein
VERWHIARGTTHMRKFWLNYAEDALLVSMVIIIVLALYSASAYFGIHM